MKSPRPVPIYDIKDWRSFCDITRRFMMSVLKPQNKCFHNYNVGLKKKQRCDNKQWWIEDWVRLSQRHSRDQMHWVSDFSPCVNLILNEEVVSYSFLFPFYFIVLYTQHSHSIFLYKIKSFSFQKLWLWLQRNYRTYTDQV